jgi:transcriptional regulator with XRE-family HTH domain
MPVVTDNLLGAYLRDRRTRLDPAAFGFSVGRRRTPGLRREEVAQRSNISPTWYTWLEQGRGGAPSADVLNRIARGLMLTDIEREHLFLLGLGRPPEVRYKAAEGVTPRLQRVLDSLEVGPALVKTATWDIIAWNRAAAAVLTDYGALPPGQRNILASCSATPMSEPRSLIGTPSPVSWSDRSGRMRRAPAPFPKSASSWTICVGSAPSSKRYGVKMTLVFTARGSSASGIRPWARSTWNIPRLPSMVDPTSS